MTESSSRLIFENLRRKRDGLEPLPYPEEQGLSDVEYFHALSSRPAYYRVVPGERTLFISFRPGNDRAYRFYASRAAEDIRAKAKPVALLDVPEWAREGERDRGPDLMRQKRVDAEPVPLTPEQLEAQRELYRATKAVTWGYLMGSPTGRFQVNHPELAKAAATYLAEADDVVAGKGSISGDWFIGHVVPQDRPWRGETLIESPDGVRRYVSTKSLKVVKKRA